MANFNSRRTLTETHLTLTATGLACLRQPFSHNVSDVSECQKHMGSEHLSLELLNFWGPLILGVRERSLSLHPSTSQVPIILLLQILVQMHMRHARVSKNILNFCILILFYVEKMNHGCIIKNITNNFFCKSCTLKLSNIKI